jgi:TM2 domain-containing membrane protein YozV
MIIGQIESYDSETKTGLVKDQDEFFKFDEESWKSSVPPDSGDEVTFELKDNVVVNMRLIAESTKLVEGVKKRWIAMTLAFLLGMVGAHRFYLGFYKLGLAQLALTVVTHGYGVLWGFIDAVLLFANHINKDAKGRPLK